MANKLETLWANIIVEPSYFLLSFGSGLMQISSQQLYTLKACRNNLNHNDTVCSDLSKYPDIRDQVHEKTASIQGYNGFLQSLPAILFALFAGPFSDRYGRKPTLLIALVGYIQLSIVYIINSYYFNAPAEWLLFECLQDVTGGEIVFQIGTFAIIVECTNEKNRTRRMAIMSAFGTVGFVVGLNISLVLKKWSRSTFGIDEEWFGWTSLYVLLLFVHLLNVLYIILRIKNTYGRSDSHNKNLGKSEQCRAVLSMCLSGFKCVLKKRPSEGRTWLLLMIIIINIHKFTQAGTSVVTYLFFKIHFNEDEIHLMYVAILIALTELFVGFIVIPFLNVKLKWKDSSIMIHGTFIIILGYLVQALEFHLWAWYVGHFFSAFQGSVDSTSKSLVSKLVEVTEIGSILSMVGVLRAILAIGAKPFFAGIYEATLSFQPEIFMFVAISLLGLKIILTGIVHFGIKKTESFEKSNDVDEGGKEMEQTRL